HKNGLPCGTPDKLRPARQLAEIRKRVLALQETAYKHWKELSRQLAKKGVRFRRYSQLTEKQRKFLDDFFHTEVYPVLTPQAIDPAHPFPTISNLSINFIVQLQCPDNTIRFARLRCPSNVSRFVFVPRTKAAKDYVCLGLSSNLRDTDVILLEDLIRQYLETLFYGNKILACGLFRITRNTDLELAEEEADDLLEAIRDLVDQRRFGDVVRLEFASGVNRMLVDFLARHLEVRPFQIYKIRGPLAFSQMLPFYGVDRPGLKLPPQHPRQPDICGMESMFPAIRAKDRLLYHPYDSFCAVLEFIRQASEDPDVMAIKQTLYRVGANSPIVGALMEARRRGKQVTAVVELKARFDEERNITWAEELEDAGVNVVYGLKGMKIHAKLCLVVRREGRGLTCYAHIGTGNYNPSTARIYTDMGLLTADPQICADITDLFNYMTGYAVHERYQRLLVSPVNMRRGLLSRIEREIEHQRERGNGQIIIKCNHLVDEGLIRALYRASQAGVRIDLQVRGICCLRPGLPGVSENIDVTSVVGRFLEHPRIYWFCNNGADELYMGSADMMPRNLNRRVEVLTPVLDKELRDYLRNTVLKLHLKDTVQCYIMLADGEYLRIKPGKKDKLVNSQESLIELYSASQK
ncbi:MAG: polyphosphate kinase 1, partial [Desulfovibrio fairfieldensis]|nr:polyphosphate kinase 1 [Desulfovibrio fairfieldensis]